MVTVKVSERSIVVTCYAALAIALLGFISLWLLLLVAALAAAPFVYLRLSWKRDLQRRRKEHYWK